MSNNSVVHDGGKSMLTRSIAYVNNEKRIPLLLELDTSGSMRDAMSDLNAGIRQYFDELRKDPKLRYCAETAIITYGGIPEVDLIQDFALVDEITPPVLTAGHGTPMGQANNRALDVIQARKQHYNAQGLDYTRPMIWNFSDGAPTDEWRSSAARIHHMEAQKKILYYAVGVGDVNMEILTQIAPPNRPPLRLTGLSFTKFFELVSRSQQMAAQGEQFVFPAAQ